jgi:hypothetical protein
MCFQVVKWKKVQKWGRGDWHPFEAGSLQGWGEAEREGLSKPASRERQSVIF